MASEALVAGDRSALPLCSEAESASGFQWTRMAFAKGRVDKEHTENILCGRAIVLAESQVGPLLCPSQSEVPKEANYPASGQEG